MGNPTELFLVVGTRPNLVKISALMRVLTQRPSRFTPTLIHTGQHYDHGLSQVFFEDLGIPKPAINLEVGSGSHGQQTAEILLRFEPILRQHGPGAVIVVGDVNSTLACALAATQLGITVAHVEAGLRSFDRTMPEEINRVLTDAISDLLFASEASGIENLRREGVADEKVHVVGNIMVDTLLRHREAAEASNVINELGLAANRYAVVTLHRPSSVDDAETLRGILGALSAIGRRLPIIWPMHPRTRNRLAKFRMESELDAVPGLRPTPPLGYLDFLKLQAYARFVLTDSGGIQEETTVLRIPCLTLRDNTDRPVTIAEGTNVLVGTDPQRIVGEAERILSDGVQTPANPPELWDGKAAERIIEILDDRLIP